MRDMQEHYAAAIRRQNALEDHAAELEVGQGAGGRRVGLDGSGAGLGRTVTGRGALRMLRGQGRSGAACGSKLRGGN
jgi:hypothetical protein